MFYLTLCKLEEPPVKPVKLGQLQSAKAAHVIDWADMNFCIAWKCLAGLCVTRFKWFGLPFIFKLLQSVEAAVRERMRRWLSWVHLWQLDGISVQWCSRWQKKGHGGISLSACDSPLLFHKVKTYSKSHLFFLRLDNLNGPLVLFPSPSTVLLERREIIYVWQGQRKPRACMNSHWKSEAKQGALGWGNPEGVVCWECVWNGRCRHISM